MTDPTGTQLTRRRTAAARRRDVIAAGGRAVSVLLPPEAAADINAIQQRTGETLVGLFCRLLSEEQRRGLRRPEEKQRYP